MINYFGLDRIQASDPDVNASAYEGIEVDLLLVL